MFKKLFIIISISFLCMATLHLFSQRPLWFDEAPLHDVVVHDSYDKIFNVLRRDLTFPRVHLAAIKIIGQPFDYNLISVRFFSFVAMIGAFFVWMRLYRRDEISVVIAFLAMLAFACSYRMGYYAAEFKPYSADVLMVALYVLFLSKQINWIKQGKKGLLWLSIVVLPISILFSYTAMLVFWMVPFNFLLVGLKSRKNWDLFIGSVVVCVAYFALAYAIDLQYSLDREIMYSYFKTYFISTSSIGEFFSTFGQGIRKMTGYCFGFTKYHMRAATVFVPFFLYGLIRYGFGRLKNQNWKILDVPSVGFVLFVQLVVLGLLQKYPFTGERITLFFMPFIFYFIVKAIGDIPNRWLRQGFISYWIGFCVVCFVTAVIKFGGMY